MKKAALAQTIGVYEEHPVSGPLSQFFRCAWRHTVSNAATSTIIVVPDACLDLQLVDGTLRVAGPDRSAVVETLSPQAEILGLRFHPGRAHHWLRENVSNLTNQRVNLFDIWGLSAEPISDALASSPSLSTLVRVITQVTQSREPHRLSKDVDMHDLYAWLLSAKQDEHAIMRQLRNHTEESERTLRRRFIEAFGYGPQTLQRILRFQRFLKLHQQDGLASMAALAADAGYADQSHLVRESRRLSTLPPSQLARS